MHRLSTFGPLFFLSCSSSVLFQYSSVFLCIPFSPTTQPSAHVQTLSSPPPPLLIRSPLIPSILPSPGENLSIFNAAASSAASCHSDATAISKPNTVVSQCSLVDLAFHSRSNSISACTRLSFISHTQYYFGSSTESI